ncbi:Undecaprenyl-phosphate N-acetylglucosaminyl 1-phosphate transferase [Arcticibacter svalbardensis MN12-7]|uniref:Undecaprenyl-phosphate N-acetylglucosaminyl 1-phosphate transferase n=1 Tax=Arcticibacter svalbardensis MN12-7 TaxID=1150600 RepID=R9GYH0_9SPHI|nr:MraY family glycosyltransferase [Arcticibacter svalbardensis]EOR94029.1 Undecaprenyl-phosphate N-acetylglucosaminyl 1-phosphate transferase [Arcticibacter svalbardensis MN12-7]
MRPELPFVFSLLAVALSISPLITIAIRKRLFDLPSEDRKIHKRIVPNLGGLAIFSGFLLSVSMFIDLSTLKVSNYILCGGIVIFITGLKDDIIGVDPLKKFVAQFIAAFIVTMLGDIRILDLGGFMGIYNLSYPFSIGLSVIAIVGIVNAFNLIDGIDGLAGSLGLLLALVYAWLFYQAGEPGWLYVCMALGGALTGFLIHNISPAKIFMGDSGSLMLGYIAAVLSIQFINTSAFEFVDLGFTFVSSAPALAMAIIILPLFDTLRVFAIRLANNQSPFKADRNHLHHRMLSLGLSHMMATLVLVLITGLFIATALVFQSIGSNQLVGILIIMIIFLNTLLSIYIYSRKRGVIEQEILDEPLDIEQDELPIQKIMKSKMDQNEMLKKISKN